MDRGTKNKNIFMFHVNYYEPMIQLSCWFKIVPLVVFVSIIVVAQNFVNASEGPSVKDQNLKVEDLGVRLASPTSMAFIDNNTILVLEKGGDVRLISNGVVQENPVLNVPVDTVSERGLLGIAILNNGTKTGSTTTFGKEVFLYFTESVDGEPRNRIYKYDWDGHDLINPFLLLDLPAEPGPNHDGGKLALGPNNYLYAVVGDLNHRGQVQNIKNGPLPDNTSGILRVDIRDGKAPKDNPFYNVEGDLLDRYFAYGVRNSFGLAIDPITGLLWDTENGQSRYDEINLVKAGFNSGWSKIMGPIAKNPGVTLDQLVSFQNSSYADPVFSWKDNVGVTDIEFLSSSKLGEEYINDIFIGDINNGNMYHFQLNEDRTAVEFESNTIGHHLVADNIEEVSAVTFGTGFNGITDIVTGPDGFMYVLSDAYSDLIFGSQLSGKIYKISPLH
jgi:glucose/arabinose dehydrogenase